MRTLPQRRPQDRRIGPSKSWSPRMAAADKPHGRRSRPEVAAFVALLFLASLAGGAWADARTQEDGTVAGIADRTERPADQNVSPSQAGGVPTAHPRGLPRKTARPRAPRWGEELT